MEREQQTLPRIQLISAMAIFGTIGIFVTYIPLSSSLIALVRGAIGTAFLLLVLLCQGKKPDLAAIKRNLLILALSGGFIGTNWILLFESYRYTLVSIATLCYYFAPILVILLSPILLGERFSLKKILCVLAALLGMALISGIFQGGEIGPENLKGILFGLGAAAFYAGVVLLNKKLKDIAGFDATLTQLFFAALVIAPYALTTGGATGEVTVLGLVLLLVVGVIHTGFAYTLYFSSIQKLPAQTAAIFSYIDPVISLVLSALILGERMGISGLVGAVLILGSTFLSEISDHGEGKNTAAPKEA